MLSRRKPPTATSTTDMLPSMSLAPEVPIITKRENSKAPSLPNVLKFPLVVLITFSLTVLLNTVLVEFTGPKLYPVSRNLNQDYQVSIITGWRVLELGLGWFSGFDAIDMLSFTLLTRVPHAYLLGSFYQVPLIPTLLFMGTECAACVPFYLLRRPNPHHTPAKKAKDSVASDRTTFSIVVLVATAMYALPTVLSLLTWLPVHLAVNFEGLKTLQPAHDATLYRMLPLLLPLGISATDFLFTSTAAFSSTIPVLASGGGADSTILEFDPETATLTQTLHRNVFWHKYLPAREQALFSRATTLVVWTVASTWFLGWVEVEGCDALGALGWAGMWGLAATATSFMLGWIADVAV